MNQALATVPEKIDNGNPRGCPYPATAVMPSLNNKYVKIQYGKCAQYITCRHCIQHTLTEVELKPGRVCFLMSLPLLCAPFCTNKYKDHVHICRYCRKEVGRQRCNFPVPQWL